MDYKNYNVNSQVNTAIDTINIVSDIIVGNDERKIWMPGYGCSITAQPHIYKDVIYVGCCDGYLHAVSLDGSKIWKFYTDGPIYTAIAVESDTIFLTSSDGYLYALSTSGELKWKFQTGDKVVSSPVIHNGIIYFGSNTGFLYAVSKSGELKWKFQTGAQIYDFVNIYQDTIYFGSFDGNLYALSLDGREKWRFHIGEIIANRPLIYKDHIYSSAFDGKMHCLDLKGREKWSIMPSIVITGIYGALDHEGKIYFPCIDNFYCVSADTGETIWKFHAGELVFTFNLYDGVLYIGSSDNNLYAVDCDKGELIWKYNSGSKIECVPTKYKDRIYFGTWDGKLICISDNGREVWSTVLSSATPSRESPETSKKADTMKITFSDFKENEINTKEAGYITLEGNKGFITKDVYSPNNRQSHYLNVESMNYLKKKKYTN